MNRTQFLHEMKEIASIEQSLEYHESLIEQKQKAINNLQINLKERINKLLDTVIKYIPEEEK